MGLFNKGKKPENESPSSLRNDITTAKDWIASALNYSGYRADFTLESLKEVDRFFDEQADRLLAENTGTKLFAIGSYIGEVIISICGGQWETDDNDPKGEINITVRLKNGSVIWPVQRAMKRYQEGIENAIYPYVYSLIQR
jgi:hypothetical protein